MRSNPDEDVYVFTSNCAIIVSTRELVDCSWITKSVAPIKKASSYEKGMNRVSSGTSLVSGASDTSLASGGDGTPSKGLTRKMSSSSLRRATRDNTEPSSPASYSEEPLSSGSTRSGSGKVPSSPLLSKFRPAAQACM